MTFLKIILAKLRKIFGNLQKMFINLCKIADYTVRLLIPISF